MNQSQIDFNQLRINEYNIRQKLEFGDNEQIKEENDLNNVQKCSGDQNMTKLEELSNSKQEDSSQHGNMHNQSGNQLQKPQKQPWTEDEDKLVFQLVQKYGAQKWTFIATNIPGRIGKQCRERWHNHLNPVINKNPWSDEEEWVLFLCHQLKGNKWAEITQILYGRTDNSIKNHWNSSMKKRIPELKNRLQQFQDKQLINDVKLIRQGRYSGIETDLLEKLFKKNQQFSEENMSSAKRKFQQMELEINKRGRKPKVQEVQLMHNQQVQSMQSMEIQDPICYQTPEKMIKNNTGEMVKRISQFNLSQNINSIKKIDSFQSSLNLSSTLSLSQTQTHPHHQSQPQCQSQYQNSAQFICESPSVFLAKTPDQQIKKVSNFIKGDNYDMMSPFMLFKQNDDKKVENSFKKLYDGVQY